jgi:hypothetical protein
MISRQSPLALAALLSLSLAGPAMADFSGQTILGPITAGSSVFGDNSLSSNDNDGWYSGMQVFGLWDGGDDVYQLNWPGGDLTLTMTPSSGDPDLFLYTPDNLDESSFDSFTNGIDVISVPNADAGTYYVLIDSAAGFEGAYQLEVSAIPGPGALALLACAALAGGCRGRRR